MSDAKIRCHYQSVQNATAMKMDGHLKMSIFNEKTIETGRIGQL